MQTITTKAMAKVAIVATGLAMATSMLSLAPIAHAACSVGTADLTIGSRGEAVTCLQQGLIAGGYSIPAGATGYFGSQTQAAVKAWQTAVGVAPAAGYFGRISRSHWNLSGGTTGGTTGGGTSTVAGCTSTSGFSPTTGQSCAGAVSTVPGCMAGYAFSPTTGQSCSGTVTYPAGCTSSAGFSVTTGQSCSGGTTAATGGALAGTGRLTNISSLGNVVTNIKEGDSVTAVVGLSADATGGDVAIQRVDATFTIGGTTGSANLNRYVTDVSLYLGGTKLASMNPDLGDKDGRVWTIRFAGLNGVIKSGTTGNLYVKVTPLSSIGINENGVTVTAAIGANGVRAVSADGISDTYVVAGDNVTHDFNVAAATTGTLTVSTGSDNPSAGQVVAVKTAASSLTTGVKLLSMNLKAQNADVTIDQLPIHLSTSDNNLGDVVSSVYLMKGSTVLSTKSVTNGVSTTTFTNLNQTITKDSIVNYTVLVDLGGTGASGATYAEGTTITASSTTYGWDVSDANGASVTPTGSVTGNDITLRTVGVSADPKPTSATATKTGNGTNTQETGTFTFTFNVTAFGQDMYVSSTTNGFTPTTVYDQNGTATTTAAASITSTATRMSTTNNYVVYDGQTKQFTVSYTKLGESGYALAKLLTLKFGATEATILGSTLTLTSDYQTPQIYLAD